MLQTSGPIFDHFSKHVGSYIGKNGSNDVFKRQLLLVHWHKPVTLHSLIEAFSGGKMFARCAGPVRQILDVNWRTFF